MTFVDFIPSIISIIVAVFVFIITKKIEKTNTKDISYLSEKGKNAATKEDVHEITKMVEELKKKLDYDNEIKLIYSSDSYKYLTDYYNSLCELSVACMTLNIWKYNTVKDIDNHIYNIDELFVKFHMKFLNLQLYFESEELEEWHDKIYDLLDVIVDFVSSKHYDLIKMLDKNVAIFETYDNGHNEFIRAFRDELDSKYADELSDNIDEYRNVIKRHLPKPSNEK